MASAKQATAVQLAKVSPAFLHSNSTCHTWPFSAVAELIDNAYDPDVDAKEMWIDVETTDQKECLIFQDNGNGMNPDKLHKMLSFGFSEKEATEQKKPIGRYGNGFKSGSMRLGDDALVFTKCQQSASVGLLSQTYLQAIGAETVRIPVVTWTIARRSERIMKKTPENKDSLEAILQHSLLKTLDEIDRELKSIPTYGTKIIIYNLKRDRPNSFELDFQSDPKDIRYSETTALDTSTSDEPMAAPKPEYKKSLRKYCSILYKKPRLKIYLRGEKVDCTLIEKSLKKTLVDKYKPPKDCIKRSKIKLTFGYTRDEDPEAYGLMLYHNNRLIKACEKVGCQKKATPGSTGVQGIAEVNLLEPNNIKQDFIRDGNYAHFMTQATRKLNDYVNEKIYGKDTSTSESDGDKWTWVQCDACDSWRRLPIELKDDPPDKWFCYLNPDNMFNRCDIPEESQSEDDETVKPYKKTYKKKNRCDTSEESQSEDDETVKQYKKTYKKKKVQKKRKKKQKKDAVKQIKSERAESTPVKGGMLQTLTSDVQEKDTPQQNEVEVLNPDAVKSVPVQEGMLRPSSFDVDIQGRATPQQGAQGRSGGGQDPKVGGSETEFSSAMVSDEIDSQPSGRKQKFAEKRKNEDSEGSSTHAKVPKVVGTSNISCVDVSADESRDKSVYRGNDKSSCKGTSQGSGDHIDEAGDRRLGIQFENIDLSVESTAANSMKQELIIVQKRLKEREEELKKKKRELLNLSELRKTELEAFNKLKKEKEEVDKKINSFQRQRIETEEKLWSEKRQLIDEIDRLKEETASLQQELVKWKGEATNLADAIRKNELELESVKESTDQIQQECNRKTQELEENRASKLDLQVGMLELMQLKFPDYEFGPPEEIENVIQQFMEANKNGSERS